MKVESAARILLVDDDRTFRLSTAELLSQEGYEVVLAADGHEAGAALEKEAIDLLLLDLRMPGLDGLKVVEALRALGRRVPILMISGFGTVESAVEALHLGADDFLTKPVDPDVLSARVAQLLERRPTGDRVDASIVSGLVGRSESMKLLVQAIRRVGPTDTTVLITGETGTGKELTARAVHESSRRSSGPFIPVNCAALAEGLLESELFGHVHGAFTGATRDKAGLFEAANGGSIFLDEVGDMSLRLQQRLLRVLQEREVVRVGDTRARPIDVRVIAATNKELEAEVKAGRFRDDLFYRLNVFRVDLPPLRERRNDIALLVEAALHRLRERFPQEESFVVSPFAMRLLRAYDWPGNVRELFAAVESAAINAERGRIEAQHLPENVRRPLASATGEGARYRSGGAQEDERHAIVRALREAEGVRARAAESLGMSRTTLWRKMKKYGLESD